MNGAEMVYLAIAVMTCLFSGLAAIFAFLSWRRRKTSVPDFSVYFPGKKSSRIALHDKMTKIVIEVENIGKEIAENVEAHVFFPPECDISPEEQPDYQPKEEEWLSKEGSDSEFPNYWNAEFYIGDVGPDYSSPMEIMVKSPTTPKGYEIFVDLICKGLGTQTHHLLINVI
jgi:hypothetical protein